MSSHAWTRTRSAETVFDRLPGLFWVFCGFYQRGAAQQDDDVDEELEEFVLNDDETDLPAAEATPPGPLGRVHVQDGTAAVAA